MIHSLSNIGLESAGPGLEISATCINLELDVSLRLCRNGDIRNTYFIELLYDMRYVCKVRSTKDLSMVT